MKRALLPLLALLLAGSAFAADPAAVPRHDAPPGVRLYIISPLDGSTVGQTFTVRFGLAGMGIAPAGIGRESTGHHHLLIDVDGLPPDDAPIPADDRHIHFGGGQTETIIRLEPGTHTLQLNLGDENHMQFNPPVVSPKITVHVR